MESDIWRVNSVKGSFVYMEFVSWKGVVRVGMVCPCPVLSVAFQIKGIMFFQKYFPTTS